MSLTPRHASLVYGEMLILINFVIEGRLSVLANFPEAMKQSVNFWSKSSVLWFPSSTAGDAIIHTNFRQFNEWLPPKKD
jgi:hypothetical protein